MGDVAQGMLRDAMIALRTNNQELLEDVERRDDQLGLPRAARSSSSSPAWAMRR